MNIIIPETIGISDMTSSIAIDADSSEYGALWQGEWSAGTYALGDVVYKGIELYESLIASNSADPEVGEIADPPSWLNLGYINRWRMFDEYTNTVSSDTSSIEIILSVDEIDHVAFFNMSADNLLVEMLDLKSLLNSDNWTLSSSGTGEYYYSETIITEPEYILENGSNLAKGVLGSLAVSQWSWGDNDTLGENRIYVRLSDSADPDIKTPEYLKYRTISWSYSEDLALETLSYSDWYEYYYLSFPGSKSDSVVTLGYTVNTTLGDQVRITLTGSGTVECGMSVVGIAASLGLTRWSPEMTAIDYSNITTDGFGRTSLTKRSNAKEVSGDLIVESSDTSYVYKILKNLLGTAAVFDFNNETEGTDYEPLIIYGFIKDFREVITFATMTDLNLTIQGLI